MYEVLDLPNFPVHISALIIEASVIQFATFGDSFVLFAVYLAYLHFSILFHLLQGLQNLRLIFSPRRETLTHTSVEAF